MSTTVAYDHILASLESVTPSLSDRAGKKAGGAWWFPLLPRPLQVFVHVRGIQSTADGILKDCAKIIDHGDDESFDSYEGLLRRLDRVVDSSLGTPWLTTGQRRSLTKYKTKIREALYALERGYAPGQVPPRETRRDAAAASLHQFLTRTRQ